MPEPIYDEDYQQALFDQMQSSYERVSNITSFGFSLRWRRQLVALLDIRSGMCVSDLMAGGGETWSYILPHIGQGGYLTSVDFSRQMVKHARLRAACAINIAALHENALQTSIMSGSMDVVLCVYGVKTLSPDQHEQFVSEVRRILKPGGLFGIVEVSVPPYAALRLPYLFYLSRIVPIFGRLLLGNPDNYRMLSVYVSAFGDCRSLEGLFRQQGFEVAYHRFFWGCATALVGRKCSV